jgi:hypothetical protein
MSGELKINFHSWGVNMTGIGGQDTPEYPVVPESPSNHFANFLLACKGQEKTRSPFEVAGPLSQVFCLGVIAQRLNTKLIFDRKSKQITNNKIANELLKGPQPRNGWEEFYKL